MFCRQLNQMISTLTVKKLTGFSGIAKCYHLMIQRQTQIQLAKFFDIASSNQRLQIDCWEP